jgi:hypothetical protein
LEQPVSTHDLVSISYSGNHGYYEPLTNAAANAYVSNPALYPDGFARLPSSAPDPRFSIVTQISNADYDGLTVPERHEGPPRLFCKQPLIPAVLRGHARRFVEWHGVRCIHHAQRFEDMLLEVSSSGLPVMFSTIMSSTVVLEP